MVVKGFSFVNVFKYLYALFISLEKFFQGPE